MSGINGGKSAIDKAVRDAYEREGHITADGRRDWAKVCACMFEAIAKDKVLAKNERAAKARTKGELVTAAFPNLPGPDDGDALAVAVYKQVMTEVWALAHPAADKRLQRMVGMNMGNGYVLCRTKVTTDQIDAVYITDVMECINADFVTPDNDALDRRIATSTRNREMLLVRQPHNAEAYAKGYDRSLKNALSAAHNQMRLTLGSVTANLADTDDEE